VVGNHVLYCRVCAHDELAAGTAQLLANAVFSIGVVPSVDGDQIMRELRLIAISCCLAKTSEVRGSTAAFALAACF